MQKQSSKKMLSILIATLLVLWMLPMPAQAAIVIDKPTTGQNVTVGEEVWVNGTGASPGALVKVYWDQAIEAKKLAEGYAKGNGLFNITVKIPEDVVGDHWLIVDGSSKQVVMKPKITLKPESGIPGDTIKLNGTGFTAEKKITAVAMRNATWSMNLTTSPSPITTSTKGSFTCTFTVPSKDYGTYTINATDASGKKAEATFTIGPSITLTPEEGPSGTVVTITGRGFKGKSGKDVTVLMNNTGVNMACQVVDTITVKTDETFSGQFVVPTLSVDTYTVKAKVELLSGTLDFEVTGKTAITLKPISGAPGDSVVIEGINFTAIADTDVTIDFGTLAGHATLKTNSTGGFKASITVPSLTPQVTPYDVKATDDYNLNATAGFRVALVTLAISPTSGPTGCKVLIIGGGFTPSKTFNVTIDGELMAINGTGTLTGAGGIPSSHTVYLPTVSTGAKKITAMDADGVSKSVDFQVTKTTEVILTPASAPPKYNITIEANYFTAKNLTGLTVTLYNSTYTKTFATAEIKAYPKFVSIKTNATGSYEGWFLVPDNLALGDYKFNVTDANDLGVWEKLFKVVAVTVEVTTSMPEYLLGQDVTFKVKGSFASAGEIEITDPTSFKSTLAIAAGDYQKIGDWYYAYKSLALRSDAPLGTWSWLATIEKKEVSGTFKVSEVPTLETLSARIADLEESVATVSDIVDELSSTVEAQAADITAISESVSDLASAVDALTADLADVAAAAAAAQTAASNAATAATDAATAASGAAEAAQSAQAAAEAAQSTAAGISTAVYGAMALSLVAAIAAIVAVITLQRKVAG